MAKLEVISDCFLYLGKPNLGSPARALWGSPHLQETVAIPGKWEKKTISPSSSSSTILGSTSLPSPSPQQLTPVPKLLRNHCLRALRHTLIGYCRMPQVNPPTCSPGNHHLGSHEIPALIHLSLFHIPPPPPGWRRQHSFPTITQKSI